MRDLFRAEIEAGKERGSLWRVFENTWVLVGLLAVALLVIAYGVVSARMRSAEQPDEAAGEFSSWRRTPRSEVDRVVTLARHQNDDGDVAGAERTLSAFAALLPVESPERNRVENLLSELRARNEKHPRDLSLLVAALDRADKLAAEGKTSEAREIWNGAIAIYADDPRAEADVERARRNLSASTSTSEKRTTKPPAPKPAGKQPATTTHQGSP